MAGSTEYFEVTFTLKMRSEGEQWDEAALAAKIEQQIRLLGERIVWDGQRTRGSAHFQRARDVHVRKRPDA